MHPATAWLGAVWAALAVFFAWDLRRWYRRGTFARPVPRRAAVTRDAEISGGETAVYALSHAGLLGVPLAAVGLWVLRARAWQSLLYRDGDTTFFATPDTLAGGVFPAFITGIGLAGFIHASLAHARPRYPRLAAFRSMLKVRTIDLAPGRAERSRKALERFGGPLVETHVRAEMRGLLWANLMLWLLAAPWCILFVDDYYRVDAAGLTASPLLALGETRYAWGEIERLRVRASYGKESKGWSSRFEIQIRDGPAFNLWDNIAIDKPPADALIAGLELAAAHGVPVDFEEPAGLTSRHLAEYGPLFDLARRLRGPAAGGDAATAPRR